MNKYNAKKTTIDGITFDSIAEANRYKELKLLQRVGEITTIELQPKFKICPAVEFNGKKLRARFYIADFKYWDVKSERWIVEDTKGMKTQTYSLKRSLFLFNYPEYVFKES